MDLSRFCANILIVYCAANLLICAFPFFWPSGICAAGAAAWYRGAPRHGNRIGGDIRVPKYSRSIFSTTDPLFSVAACNGPAR
jgi:hypothetical protein